MITRLLFPPLIIVLMLQSSLFGQNRSSSEQIVIGKNDPWTNAAILQPDALKKLLSSKKKDIVIIYTGPQVLFERGHIPGAIAVGQVSEPTGENTLKQTLQKLSKKKEIILYCGCCLWNNCPNIRPAFSIAHEQGFKNVKVLDLPNNFRLDWETKGFPIEK